MGAKAPIEWMFNTPFINFKAYRYKSKTLDFFTFHHDEENRLDYKQIIRHQFKITQNHHLLTKL